jgi:nucleotide-binding universal stress UspA family protein
LYTPHVLVGPVAETSAAQATRLGCDGMALGPRGMGALSTRGLGSVAMQVLHDASVPVTLVK